MSFFQEFSLRLDGKVVLLSIKPKYADLILTGFKKIEFRRLWAARDINVIVLYSSYPVQKIIGMVEVKGTITSSASILWTVCQDMGGGLTKEELQRYLVGKPEGIGIVLGQVFKFSRPINPSDIINNFKPPQSFRYLDMNEYTILLTAAQAA